MQQQNAPVVMQLISSLGIGGAERLLIDMMAVGQDDPTVRSIVVIMNEAVDPGLLAQLESTGVPVYRLNRREGHKHPKYMVQLLRIIRKNRVSIIHTHNEGSRAWGMLAKLLNPGVKLVYTVHSHDNANSITGMKRMAYTRLVDATVAISAFVADTAEVLKPRNLTLVPNGVALDRFRGIPRPAPAAAFRLLNVARFIPFKGQDVLIEALHICAGRGLNLTCTFAGTIADQEFHDRLQTQVERHGLRNRVRFEVGRSDVESFMAEADAFVLSSRDEGFGVALVEAMAAGLPVISAKVGGAAEIVQDGVSGLHFVGSDPVDLAEKIGRLASDRMLQSRLTEGGLARARDYDIRNMVAALGKLYRRLA